MARAMGILIVSEDTPVLEAGRSVNVQLIGLPEDH
jgi:hypothetical protein